jgi:Right handed beta helix region
MVIRNQHHRTYANLRISSASGDCLQIVDSSDITINASQIGPCGGNGINVNGGREIRIYDSYIHPETRSPGCCDHNDGVLVQRAATVTIQGNVIAYGESNAEAPLSASGLTIVGNFLLNPRGPYPRGQNVQAWNASHVVVRNNYTLSSRDTRRFLYPDHQEDSINFGKGSDFRAEGNYVTGGHSRSGCGLIADDGANGVQLVGNRVVDSGQCGIGIASGTDQVVRGNKIINRNPVQGGGNTALYVWNEYKSVACGRVTVSENVATEIRKDGTQSGFWNGGGCDPVTLHANVWNEAAQRRLTPVRKKLPAPLIPPEPRRCVIESPYSTQTNWPQC